MEGERYKSSDLKRDQRIQVLLSIFTAMGYAKVLCIYQSNLSNDGSITYGNTRLFLTRRVVGTNRFIPSLLVRRSPISGPLVPILDIVPPTARKNTYIFSRLSCSFAVDTAIEMSQFSTSIVSLFQIYHEISECRPSRLSEQHGSSRFFY